MAPLEEAEQPLAALELDYQVPYVLAFDAGLRHAEICRLRWDDVALDGYRLVVRRFNRGVRSGLLRSVDALMDRANSLGTQPSARAAIRALDGAD